MNSLLKNAALSLKMGVEDYHSHDPARAISGVRNITAGVLLLYKEKLRQLSPLSSDEVLLKARIAPAIAVDGQLVFRGEGPKTVDVNQIRDRFNSLGIVVDWRRLQKIVRIRNQVEHYFTGESDTRLRELIADSFLLVRDFLAINLGLQPAEVLDDDSWKAILQTAEVYEKELDECRVYMTEVKWPNQQIRALVEHLRCGECGSELLKPTKPDERDIPSLALRCSNCAKTSRFDNIVEEAIAECFFGDAYIAATDGGEPPYNACPNCGKDAFLLESGICAACLYEPKYESCAVCNAGLSIEEQAFGGLCSYHHWVVEKEHDR